MHLLNKALPIYLFLYAYFLFYWPTGYQGRQPLMTIGSIDIHPSDISFLALSLTCILIILNLIITRQTIKLRLQNINPLIWALMSLYVLIIIKYFIDGEYSVSSLRTLLKYSGGYIMLFFVPILVDNVKSMRYMLIIGVVFSIYIFFMHVYRFSVLGYILHVLGGSFAYFTMPIFFMLLDNGCLIKINSKFSKMIKILIILTIFLAGHRSAFLAFLASMFVFSYYRGVKKIANELFIVVMVCCFALAVVFYANPSIIVKSIERASTTFDVQQDTYQGRWNNFSKIIKKVEKNPWMGIPLSENITVSYEIQPVKTGNIILTRIIPVVTPHNLILEWLHLYGIIGMFIGMGILITSFKECFRFLKRYEKNEIMYNFGVAILCGWIFNLILSFCNCTTASMFYTFFLYWPLILLISVDRIVYSPKGVTGDCNANAIFQ